VGFQGGRGNESAPCPLVDPTIHDLAFDDFGPKSDENPVAVKQHLLVE